MVRGGIPKDFPLRIKRVRASAGLTQTQLANLMGVSFASVNRWENGQTRPSALAWQRIVRAEQFGIEALGKNSVESPSRKAVEPTLEGDAERARQGPSSIARDDRAHSARSRLRGNGGRLDDGSRPRGRRPRTPQVARELADEAPLEHIRHGDAHRGVDHELG